MDIENLIKLLKCTYLYVKMYLFYLINYIKRSIISYSFWSAVFWNQHFINLEWNVLFISRSESRILYRT